MEGLMILFIFVASIVAGIFLGGHVTLMGFIVVSVVFVLLIYFFEQGILGDAGITQSALVIGLVLFWFSALVQNKEYFEPQINNIIHALFK